MSGGWGPISGARKQLEQCANKRELLHIEMSYTLAINATVNPYGFDNAQNFMSDMAGADRDVMDAMTRIYMHASQAGRLRFNYGHSNSDYIK